MKSEVPRVLLRLDHAARFIVNVNHRIARSAKKLCVIDCVTGCICRNVSSPIRSTRQSQRHSSLCGRTSQNTYILGRVASHVASEINFRAICEAERVRGIEPPCAAWEAAVLPLNYTREEISDFRFAIADCNQNKFALQLL